jgi:hypothetical protein
MLRRLNALTLGFLATAVLSTGCMVDSVEDTTPMTKDTIGRLCTLQMTVTGSFAQSKAPPVHEDGTPYTGCWPIGTWTFQVQRGVTDCDHSPTLLPQYQFKVDEALDMDMQPYQVNTYMTDPTQRHRVKVSQGGDGLCEGELNLFSTDGTEVWIIKPELYADNHLGGDGEYSKHASDQWIGD